jgi:DegV family protein with EDD domain
MSGIQIVTDSASDVSSELAATHGITVVPLTIRFGSEELLDQRDLDTAEFWRRCRESKELPETAAPSPGAFAEAYAAARDAGCDGVLCLTISSRLSATYQSAKAAADALDGQFDVRVVDTSSVTMGEGLLVLAAAEDEGAGAGMDDLVARTVERMGRNHVVGVVATLEHLQRGGRIGGAKALLGSILSIKPVIQVKDGVVAEESRQRTRSRSIDYLAAKVRAAAPLERLAIANGAAPDIDVLTAKLADIEVSHPPVVVDLGAVVGTHAGPGTMGVAYQVAAGSPTADG